MRRRTQRSGFSLLEMVLALAIGMLLLVALYDSFSVQIIHVQAGRDAVHEAALARSILARLTEDIRSQVGPVDPRVIANPNNITSGSSGSGSSGSSSGSNSSSSANSNSSASSSSSNGTNSTNGSSTQSLNTATNQVMFNIGVQGDSTSLILSNYHVQRPSMDIMTASAPTNAEITSDVRVVSYWLAGNGNGGTGSGLARQEFRQALNDNINMAPTTLPDQDKSVIAPEVSNVLFEYFDGTNWNPTWDGATLAADGYTPIGPPLAIRITLTFRKNLSTTAQNTPGNDQGATYQHIVALQAANFFNQQSTNPSSSSTTNP